MLSALDRPTKNTLSDLDDFKLGIYTLDVIKEFANFFYFVCQPFRLDCGNCHEVKDTVVEREKLSHFAFLPNVHVLVFSWTKGKLTYEARNILIPCPDWKFCRGIFRNIMAKECLASPHSCFHRQTL